MGLPLVRWRVSAQLDWLIWFHGYNKRTCDRVGGKVDVNKC